MLKKLFTLSRIDRKVISETAAFIPYVLVRLLAVFVIPIFLVRTAVYFWPELLQKGADGNYVYLELLFRAPLILFFCLALAAIIDCRSRIKRSDETIMKEVLRPENIIISMPIISIRMLTFGLITCRLRPISQSKSNLNF